MAASPGDKPVPFIRFGEKMLRVKEVNLSLRTP
jgi:hypothetical protein